MINYHDSISVDGVDNISCGDNDNNNICTWKKVKKTIYCNIDTLSCQLMSGGVS